MEIYNYLVHSHKLSSVIHRQYYQRELNNILRHLVPKKEMKKIKVKQKQKNDTYSGYDLCQNCYHKREVHLGVCMLEKDKQFPCDCVEFKGIEGKK